MKKENKLRNFRFFSKKPSKTENERALSEKTISDLAQVLSSTGLRDWNKNRQKAFDCATLQKKKKSTQNHRKKNQTKQIESRSIDENKQNPCQEKLQQKIPSKKFKRKNEFGFWVVTVWERFWREGWKERVGFCTFQTSDYLMSFLGRRKSSLGF